MVTGEWSSCCESPSLLMERFLLTRALTAVSKLKQSGQKFCLVAAGFTLERFQRSVELS